MLFQGMRREAAYSSFDMSPLNGDTKPVDGGAAKIVLASGMHPALDFVCGRAKKLGNRGSCATLCEGHRLRSLSVKPNQAEQMRGLRKYVRFARPHEHGRQAFTGIWLRADDERSDGRRG